MKIQFKNNLEYQTKAINSIVDIFEGQEICQIEVLKIKFLKQFDIDEVVSI